MAKKGALSGFVGTKGVRPTEPVISVPRVEQLSKAAH